MAHQQGRHRAHEAGGEPADPPGEGESQQRGHEADHQSSDDEGAVAAWEARKARERDGGSALDGVPAALPALPAVLLHLRCALDPAFTPGKALIGIAAGRSR